MWKVEVVSDKIICERMIEREWHIKITAAVVTEAYYYYKRMLINITVPAQQYSGADIKNTNVTESNESWTTSAESHIAAAVKNVKWCNPKGDLPFNRKLSDPLYSTKQEFFNSASFPFKFLFVNFSVSRWSESPVARPRPAKDKKYKICGSFLRLLVSVISDMKKRKNFYGE